MKHILIIICLIFAMNSLTGNPMDNHDHFKNVEWEGDEMPILNLRVERYDNFGWLIIYNANNFTFAAEKASSEHIAREGHGHLFVNDIKISRLYGEPYYLKDLDIGVNEVKVTLNTNNHSSYVSNGIPIEKKVEIVVDKSPENISEIGFAKKEWPNELLPKVKIEVVRDKMKGWNLQIKIKNYSFYDSDDETGDCALLSINNINITKLFGHTYHIGILPKEHNIVKVSLMASDGSIYTFQDMAIMDFQLVMNRGQHNHDDHGPDNHLYVKHQKTMPFEISFKSEKDLTYTFQATSDLKNWSNIQEVVGTGNEIKVTDWRKAIFQKQYYRVRLAE